MSSGSSEKLKAVRQQLDSVSESFCLAKWKQVTLHLQNGRNHSCHHPYPHEISLAAIARDPSFLHNTEFKKATRQQMKLGQRPQECQYCWNIEDTQEFKNNQVFSDRITKSAESWALPHLTEIKNQPADVPVYPAYLEVSFSNTCNFKCTYCSPVFSTKWHEEALKYGPFPTSAKFNDLEYFKGAGEMPKPESEQKLLADAFWKWWPELITHLRVFRITGGEPLLAQETFQILRFLEQNPQPQLDIAVNTNGLAAPAKIDEFIELAARLTAKSAVKNLQAFVSIDGFGPYTEYSRFGLNFSIWQKNIERFLKEVPSLRLTLMCTTNILSVPEFKKFISYVLELKSRYPDRRITLDTSILRFPHHLNLCILTDEYKTAFDESVSLMKSHAVDYVEDRWAPGFYPFEINRLERLVAYLKLGPHRAENIDTRQARIDFYHFINEIDRRRNLNFFDTFKALQRFYLECKRLAESSASL